MGYIPNILIPDITVNTKVKILRATNCYGNDITKRLKIYMLIKWDPEINRDDALMSNHICTHMNGHPSVHTDDSIGGGIDFDLLLRYIGSPAIYIAYIHDYDINDVLFADLMKFVHSNITGVDYIDKTKPIDYFKRTICFMSVVADQKMMYKLNSSMHEFTIRKEPIAFGEVNFD